MERAAGILMPIFSLPGPYGIGTVGREAWAFADFLAAAGQRWWQILPVGPTGAGDSPYTSESTFAGNPFFIDPDLLARRGLLTEAELSAARLPQGAAIGRAGKPCCARLLTASAVRRPRRCGSLQSGIPG